MSERKAILTELEKELTLLNQVMFKARREAHRFEASFTIHPKGCTYCKPTKAK